MSGDEKICSRSLMLLENIQPVCTILRLFRAYRNIIFYKSNFYIYLWILKFIYMFILLLF